MPLNYVLATEASYSRSEKLDRIVERLLDRRIVDSRLEYFVRWKGFNSDWDTWEPAANLGNCTGIINKFERQLNFGTSTQVGGKLNINMKKTDASKVLSTKLKKNARNRAISSVNKQRVKSSEGKPKKRDSKIQMKINEIQNNESGVSSPGIDKLNSNSSPKLKQKSQGSSKSKAAKEKKRNVVNGTKDTETNSVKPSVGAHVKSDRNTDKNDAKKKSRPKQKKNLASDSSPNKSGNAPSPNKHLIRDGSGKFAPAPQSASKKQNKAAKSPAKDGASKAVTTQDKGHASIETQTPVMKIKGVKRKSSSEKEKSQKVNKKIKLDLSNKSVKTPSNKSTVTIVTVSPTFKIKHKSPIISGPISPNTKIVLKTLPLPQAKAQVTKSLSESKLKMALKMSGKKLTSSNKPKASKSLTAVKMNLNKSVSENKTNTSFNEASEAKSSSADGEPKPSNKSSSNKSKSSKGKSEENGVSVKKPMISPVSLSSFKKAKNGTSPGVSKKKKEQFKLSVANLIGLKKKDKQNESSSSESSKAEEGNKTKSVKPSAENEPAKTVNDAGKNKQKKSSNKKNQVKDNVAADPDEFDSDDDDVLYSLSDMEESPNQKEANSNGSKAGSKNLAPKPNKKDEKSEKNKKKTANGTLVHVPNGPAKPKDKKIRLIDSLKQVSPNRPVRPVSPTPMYTAFKHSGPLTTGIPTIAPPSQSLLSWAVPEEGNVLRSSDTQASLPISPASMSYKVLLENLPHQLHPKKSKKNGTEEEEDIERRISVRASECAFKYKEILIKKCNKYTQIWLNTHTKMKNALNPQVVQEISSALTAAKYDDSNLVMFSGLGNVFCSGVDLHFVTTGDKKAAAKKMAEAVRELVKKFITFPKLLVAVVTGPAIGLGTGLLPLCDIVYASDKASFYMPYGELSQTPEGCASQTLPECVGIAMANELMIGGRKITAIEACQLGLVSQVYWPTSMMQEVIPRVQHMALLSGKVLETTKLLMRSQKRPKLEHANESECDLLVERWASSECQRSIEQYLSNERNYML